MVSAIATCRQSAGPTPGSSDALQSGAVRSHVSMHMPGFFTGLGSAGSSMSYGMPMQVSRVVIDRSQRPITELRLQVSPGPARRAMHKPGVVWLLRRPGLQYGNAGEHAF